MHEQAGSHDEHEVRGGGHVDVVVEVLGELLAEEDDVGLDEALAHLAHAAGRLPALHEVVHHVVRELRPAVDASLRREAAVRLHDLVGGHPGGSLQAVDVLREEHAKESLLG